jgi:hypothetical protein
LGGRYAAMAHLALRSPAKGGGQGGNDVVGGKHGGVDDVDVGVCCEVVVDPERADGVARPARDLAHTEEPLGMHDTGIGRRGASSGQRDQLVEIFRLHGLGPWRNGVGGNACRLIVSARPSDTIASPRLGS